MTPIAATAEYSTRDLLAAIDDAYDKDVDQHRRAEYLLENGELPDELQGWENAKVPSTDALVAYNAARAFLKYQPRQEARYWKLRKSLAF